MDFGLLFKILLVVLAGAAGIVSVFVGKYKGVAQNPVESVAEEVIKYETGVDVNFDELAPNPAATTPLPDKQDDNTTKAA